MMVIDRPMAAAVQTICSTSPRSEKTAFFVHKTVLCWQTRTLRHFLHRDTAKIGDTVTLAFKFYSFHR